MLFFINISSPLLLAATDAVGGASTHLAFNNDFFLSSICDGAR